MIKVMIPDMPTVRELYPYLKLIENNRIYVNHGPLVTKLEEVLSDMTGVPCVTVSNGTAGLELALQTCQIGLHVVTPALTFRATGLAAARATKSHIALVDVAADTLQMKPEDSFSIQLPVATFGRPLDPEPFVDSGCEVVIDAAGAFPAQKISMAVNIATCFSFHATKFVGCGEGGFVASADNEWIVEISNRSEFGPYGTNAKMSEYHAAVALASIARITAKRERTAQVAEWYVKHGLPQIAAVPYLSDSVTILNVLLQKPAQEVAAGLLEAGIETKQWYRPYLNELEQFSDVKLPVTDYLREHLLGIPFHNFMTENDVEHVCATLGIALA